MILAAPRISIPVTAPSRHGPFATSLIQGSNKNSLESAPEEGAVRFCLEGRSGVLKKLKVYFLRRMATQQREVGVGSAGIELELSEWNFPLITRGCWEELEAREIDSTSSLVNSVDLKLVIGEFLGGGSRLLKQADLWERG